MTEAPGSQDRSEADPAPAARVLVDLSNITRETDLGPSTYVASMRRWDRVKAGWVAKFGEPAEGFHLVADANLPRKLSPTDRRQLEDLVSRGEAEIASDDVEADDVIFDHLARGAATTIAFDKYRDKMKRAEARESDVRYIVVNGPALEFVKRKHEKLLSADVTSLADAKDRQRRGLNRPSPKLEYRWYCRDATCRQRDQVVPLPDMRVGEPKCPDCGAYLDRGQRWRTPVYWVKLMTRESPSLRWTEADRFFLEDGDERVVGRGREYRPGALLDRLPLPEGQVGRISRRHLQIENTDGKIFVQDLGSTYGSEIRSALANNQWLPWTSLKSGDRRPLTRTTQIRLMQVDLMLELSGRTLLDDDY